MLDIALIGILVGISFKKFFKEVSKESSQFINTKRDDTIGDIVDKIDYANNLDGNVNRIVIAVVLSFILTVFISLFVYDRFESKKIIGLLFINFIIIFGFNNFVRHHRYNSIHYFTNKNIIKLRNRLKLFNRKVPIGRLTKNPSCDYYNYLY